MIFYKSFKYKLKPDKDQISEMIKFVGSCRFVWNKALSIQIENHEKGEKFISHFDMNNKLPIWKKDPELLWLNESPAQSYQLVLKDLNHAFMNFFKGSSNFPIFKKKGKNNSFSFSQRCTINQKDSKIKFPKLGWINYIKDRNIKGEIRSYTISCKSNKWYVSILTKHEVEEPTHPSKSIVGIDLGITKFATISNGEIINAVNTLRMNHDKLVKYQRQLSHKDKFSKNWRKQKLKVSKLHERIACIRNDFIHKTTSTISKNHAIIVLEDLKINNMSKSASGTKENPGRNVKAKSGLNKSILDQGWREFRRQLEYKQNILGGSVLTVDPKNTSRTCYVCSHVSADNRKTQSKFECVNCGHIENADLNAAKNILRKGHFLLACQVNDAVMSSAARTHT